MTRGAKKANICYSVATTIINSAPSGADLSVLHPTPCMKKTTNQTPTTIKRPPIVVVMGHIDHGKSTLLDYIRQSNVVDTEAGGITQHLSAYVVSHTTKDGATEAITFLDTPGHEAFQKMRTRGASVADVAILVVSAEDGVKPQTLEALESIKAANLPYIVAINKIDKPTANLPITQASLIEHGIYIEGMGGDTPWAAVSAKTGEGIAELLDLVILASDLAELTTNPSAPATGVVIEGKLDPKRGTTATLMIMNGTLRSGQYVVSGTTYAPVRIMEDFQGKAIKTAGAATPVGIVGFNSIPEIGATFYTVTNKKEAEVAIKAAAPAPANTTPVRRPTLPVVPLLIKADTLGTIDAIEHELDKFESDRIIVKVIDATVGDISVSDVQNVSATAEAIIVGFNVKLDRAAKDLADRLGVEIDTFSIIYELSEWLNTALKNRTPKLEEQVVTGKMKILKHFSTQKNTYVLGGRVDEGVIKLGQRVKITRRDIEIGKGTIKNLQQYKSDVKQVDEGEFGMQLETRTDIAAGDYLVPFDTVVR
jgi:translation initiation factor IF-2